MAAELITPLDHETGIPLPILPLGPLVIESRKTNWHHPWHAASAPELQTVGGQALRHSRVQLVRGVDHNQGDKDRGKLTYHDFYIGPPLPDNEQEQFRLCVLSAAGYVPDSAIDLHGDEPRVQRMNHEQLAWLRKPAAPRKIRYQDETRLERRIKLGLNSGALSGDPDRLYQAARHELAERYRRQAAFGLHHLAYQYQPMRDFFRLMVLKQDLSDIRQSELKVEEFLLTRDNERKMRLGRWLLGQATRRSTDGIQQNYGLLFRLGKLHPLMPAEANSLVVFKLGDRRQRSKLVIEKEQQLRQSLGIAA